MEDKCKGEWFFFLFWYKNDDKLSFYTQITSMLPSFINALTKSFANEPFW